MFASIKKAVIRVVDKAKGAALAVMTVTSAALASFTYHGNAMATSVLAAADKTAITAGYTDYKDTVLDILAASWAPFLGIIAILAAPRIIKKLIKSAS